MIRELFPSLLLFLLVEATFCGQYERSFGGHYERNAVVKIFPRSDQEINELKNFLNNESINVDIWRDTKHEGGELDVHIPSQHVLKVEQFLQGNFMKYELMILNVQQLIDEEALKYVHGYSFGFNYKKYNAFSSIKFELGNLARKYRNKAKLFTVGKTFLGQKMIGIKINSDGNFGKKPIVWIDGGIHAREWISVATVMYFVKTLLSQNNLELSEVLKRYEFHILPVFNVDGYLYTFTNVRGARMWRKTRSSYGGCRGADPNRNWDFKWGGTSRTACKENYRGSHAFSEVEVTNVKNYLQSIKNNLKSFWNIHSYSQYIMTPWAYTKDKKPADIKEMLRVADVFVDKVLSVYGTKYKSGTASDLIYEVGGSAIDWVYGTLGVKYAYAVELRDTGKFGFLLPADQIEQTAIETIKGIVASLNAMK